MALPKKGSRKLEVDGVTYRYVGFGWRGEGEDFCELTIERADEARQKIRGRYTFSYLNAAYRGVGRKLSAAFESVPPYVARQTILIALKRGWRPSAGGGLMDLGNLDDAIDFSGLKVSDPPGQ